MSASNNNLPKNIGAPSPFGSVGIGSSNMPANPNAHLQSQSQAQQQIGSGFPGQYHMSQLSAANAQAYAQAHALAQSHLKAQAHAQAQAQAAHAQFQAQLQAQGLAINQPHTSGIGNAGSSSPMVNTPGNASAKRPPQKPPVRPPSGFSANNMVLPQRNMELAAAARKKKQKLPEKQFQERVAAILPESALYTQLLEFESCVDAAVTRKKIDIQEAIKNPPSIQKTLRIYVFNTFANQIRTIPKKPNADPPTWTLKIIGRILEEGIDPDQAGMMQRSSSLYPKFSSFFKRVTISLDQRLYPENHIIMWDSARSPTPQEALMEVLGIEVDTRPRIIAAIWHYVKARKLQNPNDPSFFHCDPPLQKVFGEEKLKFTTVSQKISHHLTPPQPIHLEHKIKLSGNNPAGNACYDVLVDVPFPIQKELNALLANTEKTKEIDACDEAICAAIRKIHEHRKRRAFFLGFSQSPVEFINALIESQGRDLKLVAGEASRSAEKEHRSEFFNQPW
ncbi:SWIB/MDM2 domain superfamily protein [Actinidia rufa]|uniref:SWIB/MDM2 domain superfamily protein n=1 Tax=Actinidia rufa TaxID=165716 RepID=A0A7J0H8M8_9ERIC|nr:SWIB/MDM2 domain superfamily protein [Actinidia rufa]